MTPFRDISIRRKMLLMTLLICGTVLLVSVVALFAFQMINFRSNYQRDTATLAAIIAENSTAALAFRDTKAGAEVIGSLQAKPTVLSASLVLRDGTMFAQYGRPEPDGALARFPPPGEFRFASGQLLYTQPVILERKQLGTLYLRSDYWQTFEELLGFYGEVLLGIMVVSTGLAVYLSGRLQRSITDPILKLAETAQAVGERSDYSLRMVSTGRRDELGRLADSFNEMLGRIEDQDQAIKESRERFEIAIAGANDGIWDWNLRTNEIFFSPQWKRILGYANHEIENSFASWESLVHPEDLPHALSVLEEYLGGRLSTYEAEFRMREKGGRYRWILARGAVIRDADNKPIRMAGSHTDIDGRKKAEAEIRFAREKFEALVNSIDGIVWECDAQTHFSYVSRQCERILGCTPSQWLSNPRFWQEHLHPDDAVRAVELGRGHIASLKPYSYEYRMIAADGRVVWIHESGDVFPSEEGQPAVVRGIFRDITQQKTTAEELDVLNTKLVEASRHAGMADVATGVLHNVGNVLNSVNVSTTLITENLQNSELPSLVKLASLIREREADLASFLRDDPRGRLVPSFIVDLASHLEKEQRVLAQEHEHLTRNIAHIKEIVAMQQNYARLSGFLEPVSVAEVVDEAMLLNADGFSRNGIHVHRDFAQLPATMADKHKILQILINLLQNARYSLKESARTDKRLSLAITLADPSNYRISVSDNGVGIPPENLTRIFAHGFSTRKEGHGFGLHSGANAAKEMGGRLSVHSDGPGKGATFTLELPLVRPQQAAGWTP